MEIRMKETIETRVKVKKSDFKVQHGYLYIDVLIATFILAVALVSLAALVMNSTKVSASAARYTAATNIGRQQMELLKKWTASDWRDPSLPALIPWQGDQSGLTVNNMTFAVKTVVAPLNGLDSNLIHVTVIVFWNEPGGTKNVQLTTYFSKV